MNNGQRTNRSGNETKHVGHVTPSRRPNSCFQQNKLSTCDTHFNKIMMKFPLKGRSSDSTTHFFSQFAKSGTEQKRRTESTNKVKQVTQMSLCMKSCVTHNSRSTRSVSSTSYYHKFHIQHFSNDKPISG